MLISMSITHQTHLPIHPALEDGRELSPSKDSHQPEVEAAFQEVARLMGKVSELMKKHPEWRRQKPAERMDSILDALRRL
jgi:hypothetical protein